MSRAEAPAARPVEPTHACVRCGRPVPLDVAMCERCNPLGLSQPAASQVHGTVFVAVVGAVVLLAIAGRMALSGVGPFAGQISSVVPAPSGLAVTLRVTNEGSTAGATTCRITDPALHGVGPAAIIQSPQIQPGQPLTFTATIGQFGTAPRPLAVECRSP